VARDQGRARIKNPTMPNRYSVLLNQVEKLGNRLPHPTMLFVYLCLLVLLLSWLMAALGVSAVHPVSGEAVEVVNLVSKTGLQQILTHTVSNFTQFAPVGTVLVAMLGIGVAEQSGLLATAMRGLVSLAPAGTLTFFVVFAGVLSSLAADSGYVVLIPLAAALFAAAKRPPLAGIAAAFAGVSAGYSANLLIGPLDAMLSGISTEAAQLVDNSAEVSAAANYYFMAASTVFVALLATWVTEALTIPRLPKPEVEAGDAVESLLLSGEKRGLRAVAVFSVLFVILLLAALLPEHGVLRSDNGDILKGPFITGIVTIIAFYFAIAGCAFGFASGNFRSSRDVIESMETAMGTMATYLVLMFFAAQFVSYFAWTNLGLITAISGAELLQASELSSSLILILFVLMAALINLLIGSASAKWSVMAPVFIPMLMLYGIAPEATQAAYRIGDSSSNIITPLMPYFGIVVAFAQRYDSKAGMGTIMALMLPYSIVFLVAWSALLALWLGLGWPLGPA
jgi:aminobenzoyl-glutamate transport protein